MTAQLPVGPHSSSTLIRSDSSFTCDTITLNSFSMSGDFNLLSGNSYQIDSVDVLSENTLGIGVTQSSLETLGSLTSLTSMGNIGTLGVYQINGQNIFTDENTIATGVTLSSLETLGTIQENLNLATGNDYQINSIGVLSNDTLGTGITQSSLETVGNLTNLTIIGDLIVDTNTLFVDASANQVGINNTTPTFELDVVGEANITGNVFIGGDLDVTGTTTTTSSVNLTVTAPMFKLGSTNPADSIDIGVYGQYVESGVTKFQGYFRDQSDNIFKFFTGTTLEPSVNVDINPINGFILGDLLVKDLNTTSIVISTTGSINDLEVSNDLDVLGNIGVGTTAQSNAITIKSSFASGILIQTDGNPDGTFIGGLSDDFIINNQDSAGSIQYIIDGTIMGAWSNPGSGGGLCVGTFTSTTLDLAIGDNNTGFNQEGEDELAIYTQNVERVRIGDLGDVEIKNTLQVNQLNVTGDLNTNGTYQIDGINVFTDNNTLSIGVTQSSLQTFGTILELDIAGDLTVDTNTLYVQSSSNRVGINTIAPSFELDVSGDINTNSVYRINNLDVLSQNTLGTGVTQSSLQMLGNLQSLNILGDLLVDTNTLYVDSGNDKIGIGTTAPTEPLHIVEDAFSGEQQLKIENTNALGKAGLQITNTTNNFYIRQGITSSTIAASLTNDNGPIYHFAKGTGTHRFFTTNTDTLGLIITNDSNVGIGTTSSPNHKLSVEGDINSEGGVYRIDGIEVLSGTSLGSSITNIGPLASLSITGTLDVGTDVLYVDSFNDKVGINNSVPAYELDVTGDINFTGQIFQDGAILVNTDGIWTQDGSGAYITLGGFIGIGTDNPTSQLHIKDDQSREPAILIQNEQDASISIQAGTTASAQSYIEFRNDTDDSSNSWGIGMNNNTDLVFNWKPNGTLSPTINAITIDTSGNVGINETSPEAYLHINHTRIASGLQEMIRIGWDDASANDTQAGDGTKISFHTSSVNNSIGTTEGAYIGALRHSGSEASIDTDLVFATRETASFDVTERIRIKNTGLVGIGTDSPSYELDIVGTNIRLNSNSGSIPAIRLDTADSSGRVLLRVNSGGVIIGDIEDNDGFCYIRAAGANAIRAEEDGNVSIGDFTSAISFAIGDSDTGFSWVSDGVLEMYSNNVSRIHLNAGAGNIGFGNSTAPTADFEFEASDNTQLKIQDGNTVNDTARDLGEIQFGSADSTPGGNGSGLHIVASITNERINGGGLPDGALRFDLFNNDSVSGTVTMENDGSINATGAYTNISDERLKENIIDANSQWDDMKAIRFRKYNMIGLEDTRLGVIAQEIELTSPGIIKEAGRPRTLFGQTLDDAKYVKTSVIFMKGMVALQEAQARIETLEEENTILKTQMSDVLTRLTALESN
jgi:hypothetical protein